MKKIISLIIISTLVVSLFAQDVETDISPLLKNKKGQSILPETGDIAVGLDLVPFMNYLGNFANNTVGNTFNSNFLLNNNTILLKYYLSSDMAVRVKFRTEKTTNTFKSYVQDDAAVYADPLSEAQVVDVHKDKNSNYLLGIGIEKNRGKGRLRGIYGIDALFFFNKNSDVFSYGNPFSSVNTSPTRRDFGGNSLGGNVWVKSFDNSSSLGLGADVFLGVQYYIMPNICIGTEVSWGGLYSKSSQSSRVQEYWNNTVATERTVLNSPGNTFSGIRMSNPSLGLYMMFNF